MHVVLPNGRNQLSSTALTQQPADGVSSTVMTMYLVAKSTMHEHHVHVPSHLIVHDHIVEAIVCSWSTDMWSLLPLSLSTNVPMVHTQTELM